MRANGGRPLKNPLVLLRGYWESGVGAPVMTVMLVALLVTAAANAAETFTDQRQLGLKYSSLVRINRTNVKNLQLAWEYHTGDLRTSSKALEAFEDEPSLIEGNLVVCTTSRRLIALDPATGKERWVYD